MKIKLLLLSLLLAGILPNANAYDIEVDGIYYDFIDSSSASKSLEVTRGNYGCYNNVVSIVIPETVTYLNQTYPVTSIGHVAFSGSVSLTSIDIPNSVTSIGDEAFCGCKKLSSVTIGNSVTTIGVAAFEGCEKLSSVTIGNSVTTIGAVAFHGCASLTSINIPNSVTTIESGAFSVCTSLTSIDIPNSVTSIGIEAFCGCRKLSSVTIGNSVTTIGVAAFSGCTSLRSVTIPGSVTSIGDSAFSGCPLSEVVYFPKTTFNESSELWCDKMYCYQSNRRIPSSEYNFEKLVAPIDGSSINVMSNSSIDAMLISENTDLFGSHEITDIAIVDYKGNTISKGSDGYYRVIASTATVSYLFDGYPVSYELSHDVSYSPTINISVTKRTQTTVTAKVQVTVDEEDPIEKIYLNDIEVGNGKSRKLTFYPGWRGDIIATVETKYGTYYEYITASTLGMGQAVSAEAGTTVLRAEGTYNDGDARVTAFGFVSSSGATDFDGKNTMFMDGLDPNTSYTVCYGVKVAERSKAYYASETVTTGPLSWKTGVATPTSKTSARLMAETTCDAGSGTGFEWRRIDAPDIVPSSTVSCPVVDGVLAGSLRNLNSEAYYKYRPFYTSSAGNTYYGEWVGLFTGDADGYFEPEVHTYSALAVTTNSATVSGYALAGTDDITAQGFEYRKIPSTTVMSAMSTGITNTVSASGIKMTATLSGLEPGATYSVRAFATTSAGTFYGDEVEFTTMSDEGSAIEYIEADSYAVFTAMLRENPVNGTAWVSVSGTTVAEAKCYLTGMNGMTLSVTGVATDGSWQPVRLDVLPGMYLLTVTDGISRQHLRLIVR